MPGTRHPTRSLVGIVLVDKPQGPSSNQVLQRVKRLFRAQKAGHTGTLDPMATGMLPICFGAATKISGLMLEASKRYRVVARFGTATDTGDATGIPTETFDGVALDADQVERAAAARIGPGLQVPPMYSALKHEGKRLYDLAREGKEVPRTARSIEIFDLDLAAFEWPDATLNVHCSKGTYVRSLVVDLARDLGTVAHVAALRRLSVGTFREDQMVALDVLEQTAIDGPEALDRWLLAPDAALRDRPAIRVDESDGIRLRHGLPIAVQIESSPGSIRIYTPDGRFVGLGELEPGGSIRPSRIFPL